MSCFTGWWIGVRKFYIPYRGVRKWSWETYWLVGGTFSWIIAPWLLAWILVPDLWTVLSTSPPTVLFWSYFFGVMWGIGGLTFGLTMRYLGIALGMAVALGYCAAFGTLMPPIFQGQLGEVVGSASGKVILLGVAICLIGIGVSGAAGRSKEKELPEARKKETIKEFDFKKGMLVATFSGIMSSCFAYGLAAGKPIESIAKTHLLLHSRSDLWQNLPVLIVVLLGGFTTNCLWCVALNIRNKTAAEYVRATIDVDDGNEASTPSNHTPSSTATVAVATRPPTTRRETVPLARNYILSAIAGVTWYLQFFFYSMGETRMGKFSFSSWTLHMASIIIFSTLWGIGLREWRGASKSTMRLVFIGLIILVGSTMIVGYGNFLKAAH